MSSPWVGLTRDELHQWAYDPARLRRLSREKSSATTGWGDYGYGTGDGSGRGIKERRAKSKNDDEPPR